jgi:hypothetical protein
MIFFPLFQIEHDKFTNIFDNIILCKEIIGIWIKKICHLASSNFDYIPSSKYLGTK